MRRALLLPSLTLLFACTGSGPGAPNEPDDPGQPGLGTVPYEFLVYDAFSGAPVADAAVVVADQLVRTDVQGLALLRLPPGDARIRSYHPGYADYDARATLPAGGGQLTIPVQLQAPLAFACGLGPGFIRARVRDAQGRKTILRVVQSFAEIDDGAGQVRVVVGGNWRWIALDRQTYEVRVPTDGRPVASVRWSVFDRSLHMQARTCAPELGTGGPL